MVRSLWKYNFIGHSILKKILLKNLKIKKKKIIVKGRSSTIMNSLSNLTGKIYNGFLYTTVIINKNHVGYKFGEFSFTRKPYFFPKKEKNKLIRR